MKIVEKIIGVLKKYFFKQKQLNSGNFDEEINTNKEESFVNALKKENQEYLNKKSILDEIDKNPDLIDTLSYSRLVQLNTLYDERIKELKIKINQLS